MCDQPVIVSNHIGVTARGQDARARRLRKLRTGLLLVFLPLLIGCDPGMIIHQAVQRGNFRHSQAIARASYLRVKVETTHPLQGETWYAPRVEATNLSASPITVSAVELVARGTTYENGPDWIKPYPLVVQPGQTQVLGVWFDLHDNVWKTFFKQAADLRVNYVIDAQEMTAHATIKGEHLNWKGGP